LAGLEELDGGLGSETLVVVVIHLGAESRADQIHTARQRHDIIVTQTHINSLHNIINSIQCDWAGKKHKYILKKECMQGRGVTWTMGALAQEPRHSTSRSVKRPSSVVSPSCQQATQDKSNQTRQARETEGKKEVRITCTDVVKVK
jgi:hypothetical protein